MCFRRRRRTRRCSSVASSAARTAPASPCSRLPSASSSSTTSRTRGSADSPRCQVSQGSKFKVSFELSRQVIPEQFHNHLVQRLCPIMKIASAADLISSVFSVLEPLPPAVFMWLLAAAASGWSLVGAVFPRIQDQELGEKRARCCRVCAFLSEPVIACQLGCHAPSLYAQDRTLLYRGGRYPMVPCVPSCGLVVCAGLDVPPSSWCVITQERQTRALLAKEGELFLLDHGGQCQEQVRLSVMLSTSIPSTFALSSA